MARHTRGRSRPAPLLQDAEAGALLGRDFAAAVVVFHELVGRCLGVSGTDRKCLDLLSRGAVTAGDLARFTGLTTGAVTGIIDRLVAAGYAERIDDPDDRRRVLVARKAPSRLDEILPAIFGPLRDEMAAVTAKYSERELAVIADFLAHTREVLVANTGRVARMFDRPRERTRATPTAKPMNITGVPRRPASARPTGNA
jgi:DNA-binding MarR family transcriptional regulator